MEELTKIEASIEALQAQRDLEINRWRHHTIFTPADTARVEAIRERYKAKLDPLENRRLYLLARHGINAGAAVSAHRGNNRSPVAVTPNERASAHSDVIWWKNPWLLVPALVAILAAVIGVLPTFLRNASYPGMIDKSFSVQPSASSTVDIADILSHAAAMDTSLQKQDFIKKYDGSNIHGTGDFIDISKSGAGYLVSIDVADNLVSCGFEGDVGTERRLLLLQRGQKLVFSGVFTNGVVFGGGWSVHDCALLR